MEKEKPLAKPLVGREVQFINDALNMDLPIGQKGILMRYDPNHLDLIKFLVRIPATKRNFWCTAYDIIETTRHLSDIVKAGEHDIVDSKYTEEVDQLLAHIPKISNKE